MSLHIRNGRVVEATGADDRVIDIYLQNGKIVGLGSAPNGFRADQVIDANGHLILPGLIDIQARLRDPGEPEKANIASETEAAIKNGITSFHDAGIGQKTISLYDQMKLDDNMGVRIYAMLTGWDEELLNEWYVKGPNVDPDHRFTIRSVKLNCDGALGSRGAWLIEPYADRPDHFGHETLPMDFVQKTAKKKYKKKCKKNTKKTQEPTKNK